MRFIMKISQFFYGASVLVLLGCSNGSANKNQQKIDSPSVKEATKKVIKEKISTDRDEGDNVDSPAIWHGSDGENWLLATAKEGNTVIIFDASTGKFIKRFSGNGENTFARPNGIAVIDNIMLIIERDNHRVQAFSLPDLKPLGIIGEAILKRPYGVAVDRVKNTYHIYVTDNYETPDGQIPPASALGERIQYFTFTIHGDNLVAVHKKAFGDTAGQGVLNKVESIAVDREHNRLLIADEYEKQRNIKIYDVNGKFTGNLISSKYFVNEPEGIVRYDCSGGNGYWITTDQGKVDNKFEVFDRKSLKHIGTFGGEITLNTDGIALTQKSFGEFPDGAFYPVHDDGSVMGFSWSDIASALKLDCKN